MSGNNQIRNEWLVDPVTKSKLLVDGNIAVGASGEYKREDGVDGCWNFIPHALDVLGGREWRIWQQLQCNGMVTYENDPCNNLGIGKRKDFLQFADFCDFRGLVLDIGCGPQSLPTHIEYCEKKDVEFIGIDPLRGDSIRRFKFVQGLGEYLPFDGKLFDQVLYVTSIDHFVDPVLTLIEAKRVLKDEGEACVWIGEKNGLAPKPGRSVDWYEKLLIPDGAEDRFHFKRYQAVEILGLIERAGFQVVDQEVKNVDMWRKNVFIRARKYAG